MPIGIVSDDDMMGEIEDLGSAPSMESTTDEATDKVVIPDNFEPPIPIGEVLHSSNGRNVGDKNVPQALRSIIAEEAITNGNGAGTALAEAFGISKQAVSAYKNGSTSLSNYDTPNAELTKTIVSAKERIAKKASRKLNLALNHITEDKLRLVKARDLAGIAKDMSAIVKNMEPDKEVNTGPAVQFHLYAPPIKKESEFEVIDAQE